jgi:hypothetical protein
MTSVRRSIRPAHRLARAVGVAGGLMTVAAAAGACLLIRGDVDLGPSATARLLGG